MARKKTNIQVKNTLVTLPCGCRITVVGYLTPKERILYNDIEYCPKHKAAPKLYEALKQAQKGEGDWRGMIDLI